MEHPGLTEVLSNGTDTPSPVDMTKFTLKWVAVHNGVKGNERAEKAAAQGDSSPMEVLPPICCKHLPYSAAAVKQEHTETLKVKWQDTWKDSPSYARFQHIDPDFPFNKFQKISNKLSRPQASLLMQLRRDTSPSTLTSIASKSQTPGTVSSVGVGGSWRPQRWWCISCLNARHTWQSDMTWIGCWVITQGISEESW